MRFLVCSIIIAQRLARYQPDSFCKTTNFSAVTMTVSCTLVLDPGVVSMPQNNAAGHFSKISVCFDFTASIPLSFLCYLELWQRIGSGE